MIWFTSDFHFGHKNILKYCFRPFESVQEMNERLIDNINKYVKNTDTLYNLGDWSFDHTRKSPIANADFYRSKINCNNIISITGNHDPHYENGVAKKEFASVFSACYNMLRIKVDMGPNTVKRQEIVLNHYAMRIWNKSHHGSWHLYGHSHYTLPDDPFALSTDVGVDAVAGRATGLTIEGMNLPKNSQASNMTPSELIAIAKSVGLKQENYRPISIFEVETLMSNKSFKPIDHHDENTKT